MVHDIVEIIIILVYMTAAGNIIDLNIIVVLNLMVIIMVMM